MHTDKDGLPGQPRRNFIAEAFSVVIGGVLMMLPFGAGIVTFLDPVRRRGRGGGGGMVRVTSLAALPADGVPRKFPVVADKVDAWTKTPKAPIGAVYLRRTGERELVALHVSCPHAGCAVDFQAERKGFFCPCHNSLFGPDGKIADPKSPSPRDLDTLEVELRGEGEVWVKFQNFQAGHADRRPIG